MTPATRANDHSAVLRRTQFWKTADVLHLLLQSVCLSVSLSHAVAVCMKAALARPGANRSG